MKKILVLVMLMITSISFSQKVNKDTLSAGDYMILSTERYYDGMSMVVVGSVTLIVGSQISDNNVMRYSLSIVGSIFTLIGSNLVIQSHSYNKKAGLLLNENGIGLRIKL
jgi:energy-converting hydrogenase Eha subunit E